MKHTLLLPLLLLLASCSGTSDRETHNSDTAAPSKDPAAHNTTSDTVHTCFRFDEGQQHDWMELSRVNDKAWGNLHYTFEEKDSRHGQFTGAFSGDTLRIMYDGMIEGTVETTELIFLLKGDKLYEARGDHKPDANGVFRYTDINTALKFGNIPPMLKGVCP